MSQNRTLTDHFYLVIKGLAMGTANKVPGVSGGVVAFVAGFYEEFIHSLQSFNKKAFQLLFSGNFKSFYNHVNGTFLSLLLLGMSISYFSISKVLDYLIKNYELYVWGLFFGMIVASVYHINKSFKNWNTTTVISLIIGISIGIGISLLDPATENDNLWFVFFCGIISVSGMTLPGLSGSFILILIGNYVLLLIDAVNALYDTFLDVFKGDFSFTDNFERMRLVKILGVFVAGSMTGMITFSHLLTYLLKHYKNITLSLLMGFIIGSLGVVWPWKETLYKIDTSGAFVIDSTGNKIIENYKRFIPELNNETFITIAYIILGIAIVIALEWYGEKTRTVNG